MLQKIEEVSSFELPMSALKNLHGLYRFYLILDEFLYGLQIQGLNQIC